jgi:hypothetical protein
MIAAHAILSTYRTLSEPPVILILALLAAERISLPAYARQAHSFFARTQIPVSAEKSLALAEIPLPCPAGFSF